MSTGFPADADGEALQRLADHGSDFSKPLLVNFQVGVPSEQAAKDLAEIVHKLGYRVDIYDSPDCALAWTCECSTRMMATYDGIMAIQTELSEISTPFGGKPDGWGSFGNGPDSH